MPKRQENEVRRFERPKGWLGCACTLDLWSHRWCMFEAIPKREYLPTAISWAKQSLDGLLIGSARANQEQALKELEWEKQIYWEQYEKQRRG